MDVPATSPPRARTEIQAVTLGELSPDPSWRHPVLAAHHLLLLVTGGHGTVQIDFHSHSCRPGSLLRIRPGQVLHCPRAGLDAVAIRWTGELPDDPDAGQVVPPGSGQAHWPLTGADRDAVAGAVSQLVTDLRRYADTDDQQADTDTDDRQADDRYAGDRRVELLAQHQLTVVLLRLALQSQAAQSGGTAELTTFRRLWAEVELHHASTRRVEDYAARLGCSVRTLTRACLAVTGHSAKQVIDRRAALAAMRLLAATDEPIAAIGRRLGFPEPTNFGRFFVRETGLSPGAFRASRDNPVPAR